VYGHREYLTGVNAMCPSPYFHLVAGLGQNVAPANGGVVTNMFATVNRDCLVPGDDADLVIVHVASPICGMGIAPGGGKGSSQFLMWPLK
jgi:hypothetical protein